MYTAIIVLALIVAGLFCLARIMKWWRAPIVEEKKTERRKAWFDFRLERLRTWLNRPRRRGLFRRDRKSDT